MIHTVIKNKGEYLSEMMAIRDALNVINWKAEDGDCSITLHGNRRFREIQRSIPKINARVLAKELKDLEQHKLVQRTVYNDYPVLIEYTTTDHAKTLKKVMNELYAWGVMHRKKVIGR